MIKKIMITGITSLLFWGCTDAKVASYNLSNKADNFSN